MTLRVATTAIAIAIAAPAFAGSGDGMRFMGGSVVGDFALPMETMEERKFATVVRQKYDFSCGSAALATLLRYHYGDDHTEEATFRGMWAEGDRAQIRRLGFSLLDMKRYLAKRGLRANGFKVTLDQIVKAGVPGVALVTLQGYRHFVVVKGVRDGELLIGDPSTGLQVVATGEFAKSWNGIYFALESDLKQGRSTFNASGQWANYARAPYGSRFADPASLQALALTAPFYRDF